MGNHFREKVMQQKFDSGVTYLTIIFAFPSVK